MISLANGKQNKNIKSLTAIQSEVQSSNRIALSVDCVIFGFDENKLKVLLIRSDLKRYHDKWSLLGDLVRPNEDLDAAAYRILKQRTGLNDVYLEQVHTFGSVNRHPAGRVVTVTYCSLINVRHHKLKILDNELHWHDVQGVNDLAFDHQRLYSLASCIHFSSVGNPSRLILFRSDSEKSNSSSFVIAGLLIFARTARQ